MGQIEEQRRVTDIIVGQLNQMASEEDRDGGKRPRRDPTGTPGSASASASATPLPPSPRGPDGKGLDQRIS